MKKLNTNNAGRMPLWQADLDWIQAGYTEPITALVSELGIGRQYFIITGCDVTIQDGKTISMTSGWFWWNGEILPVRALEATDITSMTTPMVRLTKVLNSNPSGARNFIHADLSTETVTNVWQDDYLAPEVVERSAGFNIGVRLGEGAWTLREIIRRHCAGSESDWIAKGTGLYYKRIGRMVLLSGTVYENEVIDGLPYPIFGETIIVTAGGNIHISSTGQLQWYGTQEDRINGAMYMAATTYQATDPNFINDNPQI